MTTEKRCTQCGEVKPLDQYHRNHATPDGRKEQCKACVLIKARAYRQANREQVQQTVRSIRAVNPHYGWESGYRERAQKFGFKPTIESFTRGELVLQWGDQCYLCGGEWDQIDHVEPVHKGGHHTLHNCRPCCGQCNRAKHFDGLGRGLPRGVSPHRNGRRYMARFNGTHLGMFDTPEEAGEAAASARSKHYEETS